MTVLELKFPTGRFHATPWGRHVNEGAVEWPPSPWRILRALVATWHWKAKSDVPEPMLRLLVSALAAPSRFHLPPATTSHTRHYMPGKGTDKPKVFDTFIQLAPETAVFVTWEDDMPEAESAALAILVERLGYLGRAESLVVASLRTQLPENIATTHSAAAPLTEGSPLPTGREPVRLLAPITGAAYDAWREEFCAKAVADPGLKPTDAQKKKLLAVPADLFAALHADTGDLQATGWNLPPGAQFVNYTRPANALTPVLKPRVRRIGSPPLVARFALASGVLPAITQALAVGEQIHTVLCKQSNGHPVFTGAGSQGHQHAHVFCESIGDIHGHITHVTVYAPEGFDGKAVDALRRMQWTWGFKGHELRTVLHGIGQPHEFDSPLFGPAKKWRSLTPFVSTRHAKTFRDGRPKIDTVNGWPIGTPAHDLLRLLGDHPTGQGAQIRCLSETSRPYAFGQRRFRSLQFVTRRLGGDGRRGHDSGAAFELVFPEPVCGPLTLGYGAHFGLGLFVPVT